MSQPEYSWTSAWMQRREDIARVLQEAKTKNTVTALYLHGQPACGKSTTLLKFVLEQAKAGLAPSRVIKILPTISEAGYLESWMINLPVTAEEYGDHLELQKPLTITSYRAFTDFIFEDANYDVGDDVTLLVDVRMKPRVDDEVFFSYLMKYLQGVIERSQADKEVHVAVIFTASYNSSRTFNLIAKKIPISIAVIDNHTPHIDFEFVGENWGQTKKTDILEIVNRGGLLAISVDPNTMLPQYVRKLAIMDFEDIVDETEVVMIDPDSTFTAPIRTLQRDLAIFISTGKRGSVILDKRTSQLITTTRLLTRDELESDLAWVLKSAADPQSVRFLTCYTSEEFMDRPVIDESFGSAWNKDLMLLILTMIHKWPGVPMRKVPMRDPMNHYGWADKFRRLVVLQCIKRDADTYGAYVVTERGRCMMLWLDQGYDWGVAWLLTSVEIEKDLDEDVKKILVVMAHIMHYGPTAGAFARKMGPIEKDGEDDQIYSHCAPIVRDRASWGHLWLATGLWIHMNATGWFNVEDSTSVTFDLKPWLRVVKTAGQDIGDSIYNDQVSFGLSEISDPDWIEKPLSPEQLTLIDKELMWAYLHRVVYIESVAQPVATPGLILVKDTVCLQDVVVNQPDEFMDVEHWREAGNDTMMGGGGFALYRDLEMTEDPMGRTYKVSGLTRLPGKVFADAEEKTGLEWPELVLRTGY